MNTFDLKLVQILLAACSIGLVLFYFFPYLLVLPVLMVLGLGFRSRNLERAGQL